MVRGCLRSEPHPRIPAEAYAAARGAVIADEKPAAKSPIPKITVEKLPQRGSSDLAISRPSLITEVSTPLAFTADAQIMIAREITPPSPIARIESRFEVGISSSGLFHFFAADDA